jgi:hypothetical protein
MVQRKCKCKNGIVFDSGEVFEADKTYICNVDNEWITIFDKNGNEAKLLIDGTFKNEFILLRF